MGQMMKKIYFFITLLLCGTSSAWGCDLKGDGKWWKGTSVSVGNVKVNHINWSGTDAGDGVYDISLSISVNNPGVRNYYSSLNNRSWYREDLPNGVLDLSQRGCLEGNVITATLKNVSVGGGSLIPTINSGSVVRLVYNLSSAEEINTPAGSYMTGLSQSSYVTWDGKIYVSSNGISEGTYQINIPLYITGVSVWFMHGENYWDRVNGQEVPPPVQTLQLPLLIRISGGKVVDPRIHCDFDKSMNINHGVLRKDMADGNSKIVSLQIQCNATTSASVELKGDMIDTDSVKVNLGRGISSDLSVSQDQINWKKGMNQNLTDGLTTIYFKSVLNVNSDSDAGMFNGTAIAVVTIN